MAGNQADINAWQDQYKKATSNVDMPKTTPSVNSNPNPIAGKTPITPPAISPNPNPPTTPVTPIQAGVTPVSNPVNTGLTAGRRNQIISNLYQGMQYTPGNFANQDAFKKAYGYTGKTPDEQKIMDDFWAKNKIDSNITPNTNPLRSSFIANKLNKQNIQQSIDNDQKIATQINGYLAQGKTLDQIQSALQSNPKYTNNTALNESVNKFVTNYTNQLTNDINTKVAANPDIIKDQTTFRNTFDYNNLPAAKKAIVDNYFNSKTNGSTNQSDIQNATTHMGESVPVQAATQSLSDIETQKNNTYTNIANSRQSFIQDQFKKIYGPIDEQFKTQLDKLNQDEADTRTWETKLESTIKDQLDLGLANIAAQQNAAESQALGSAS